MTQLSAANPHECISDIYLYQTDARLGGAHARKSSIFQCFWSPGSFWGVNFQASNNIYTTLKVDGANPPCNGLSWPLTNRHLFWEWLQVAIYFYYGEKNIQKQTLINWNMLCLRFLVQLMARGETLKCQKNGWTANKPWHHDMYLKTTIGKSPYRRYIDSFILVFPLSY